MSLPTERNDIATHTTAVTIPAAAPINSDVHETCKNSRDVPTAPIHQVRRPNMIEAAVGERTGHANRTACNGENGCFAEEQRTDMRDR